jgi:hypothetical protein
LVVAFHFHHSAQAGGWQKMFLLLLVRQCQTTLLISFNMVASQPVTKRGTCCDSRHATQQLK